MFFSNPLLSRPVLTVCVTLLFIFLIAATWHLGKLLAAASTAAIQRSDRLRFLIRRAPAMWRMIRRTASWGLLILVILAVIWSFVRVGRELWQNRRPAGVITLRILHWGSPSEDRIVHRLVRTFESRHPNVHVQDINNSGDYPAKLKAMFAAGSPPDLFYLPESSFLRMVKEKLLLNLNPAIARQQRQGHFLWIKDLYPTLRHAYEFNGRQVGSGDLYGIPKDCSSLVFYVNLNLFARANLPVPFHGWTWRTFRRDSRKISQLQPGAGGPYYGAVINTSPMDLQNIIWSFGGRFFRNGNIHHPALESPPAQAALNMIYAMRFKDHSAFNATGIAHHGSEEFYNGQVGMIGPLGRWATPAFRAIHTFRWDVVPIPRQSAAISSITTVAWAIPAGARHPRHAVELLRFLCRPQAQKVQARLGLSIPSIQSVARSGSFIAPGLPPVHSHIFLAALNRGRLAKPFLGHQKFYSILQEEMAAALRIGVKSPMRAALAVRSRWKRYLQLNRDKTPHPAMPWFQLMPATALLLALPLLLWFRGAMRRTAGGSPQRAGAIFILPWLAGFVCLAAGPMIISLLLSFTRWNAVEPLQQARFTGLKNYHDILLTDRNVFHSIWVTVLYVLLLIPLGQCLALGLALLVNSRTAGIRLFRTVFFLPSVISGVAMATLWLGMFNSDYGLVNRALGVIFNLPSTFFSIAAQLPGLHTWMAGIAAGLRVTPPDWFGVDARTWSVPAFALMGMWGIGGSMIVYLAGLKSIPESYHEAARVDGASSIRRFIFITLPILSPVIFFNIVTALIGSFQIFTQAQVMTDGGPDKATNFYVLYLYHQAFRYYRMGYASALAWLFFVLLLVFTVLIFRVSRRWIYYEVYLP